MASSTRKAALYIILISLVVFIESSIPYICAERNTPEGYHFAGQVAYSTDQNMYFSFISQARDGAFVLKNKLTATPHSPVFVNLEFWLVGFVQRLTGVSENMVYHVWRFMGVVLLAIGFYMLALVVLPNPKRKWAAFAAFLCTGGFGFVFALLSGMHLIGFDATQTGIIDMRYGLLPFQQIITNPHFSFPHGLILIAYAYFIWGEQYGKTKYYILSGILFNVIGLVRPYDIIPPIIIFPLYILITNGSLTLNIKDTLRRIAPLLMIVPVFLYNVWLFKVHDIFKYWSLQGLNAGSLPSVPWHYLAYGIVGILAIVRLAQVKKYPMGKQGIFVALWYGVTFVFIHLGKYFPAIGWSPQIGVYLAAPLTLAACTVRFDDLFPPKMVRYFVIPAIVLTIFVSNVSIMMYHTRKFTGNVETKTFYTNSADMEALMWLKKNARVGDVVLATPPASQRIAKYTGASVVAAHYSVTPRFTESAILVQKTLADTMMISGQTPLPEAVHANYVYLNNDEIKSPTPGKYLSEVFHNSSVTIYKVR